MSGNQPTRNPNTRRTNHVNNTVKQLVDKVRSRVEEYNALAEKVKATSAPNKNAFIRSFAVSSEDTEAVKLRKAVEAATTKLKTLAEAKYEELAQSVNNVSDDERASINTQLKDLRDKVKKGKHVTLEVADSLDGDTEAVKAVLDELKLTGVKASTTRTSTGSSLPKPRVWVKVGEVVYKSFSEAAKALKAPVADVQKAYAETAGVDPSNVSSVKAEVVFDWNGATVTITPK